MIDREDYSYLDIRRIDARRLYIKPEGLLHPHEMTIEPGEHLIVVTYAKTYIPKKPNHYRLTHEVQLHITAGAGRKYELRYQMLAENSIRMWAEDMETGETASPVVTAVVEDYNPSSFPAAPFPVPLTRN